MWSFWVPFSTEKMLGPHEGIQLSPELFTRVIYMSCGKSCVSLCGLSITL